MIVSHVKQRGPPDASGEERVQAGLSSRHSNIFFRLPPGIGRHLGTAFVEPAMVTRFAAGQDLLDALATAHGTGIVILSAFDNREETGAFVATLRGAFPKVAIVYYCAVTVRDAAARRFVIEAGADDIIVAGLDDSAFGVRAIVQRAARSRAVVFVRAAIVAILPACLHELVRVCVNTPPVGCLGVAAKLLQRDRRTLLKLCERHNLPGPGEIVGWCRVALAASLIGIATETVESIALSLDWPSDTALRNMLRRYTGLSASQIRDNGGVEIVLRALIARVQGLQRLCKPASLLEHDPIV